MACESSCSEVPSNPDLLRETLHGPARELAVPVPQQSASIRVGLDQGEYSVRILLPVGRGQIFATMAWSLLPYEKGFINLSKKNLIRIQVILTAS